MEKISDCTMGGQERRCNEVESLRKGPNLSRGVQVKEAGEVLKVRCVNKKRRPNVNGRVGVFGRICSSFDERRKQWVHEMGFGGLLNLVDKQLPQTLCYWLMTRIDPSSEMLCVGEHAFRLSQTQVRWVLGLPKGDRPVQEIISESHKKKIQEFRKRYCGVWTSIDSRTRSKVTRKGFVVTASIVARLEARWGEDEAEDFKELFFMCALEMIMCPTQSRRLSPDLMASVACSQDARNYNWCGLVLKKLISSVRRFTRTFNNYGFAGGCGGCSLFIAIFYLDKLARNPVMWGTRPRVKVWTVEETRKACREDKVAGNGDFGATGVVDVAYGEPHPREARDQELSDAE